MFRMPGRGVRIVVGVLAVWVLGLSLAVPVVAAAPPGSPAARSAPPRPVRARLSGRTAILTWAAVPGGRRYRVLNDAGRVVWSGTTRRIRRQPLRAGLRYGWRVQAVGAHGGWSVPSQEMSVAVPPGIPSGVGATVTSAGVSIHWRPSAGAARFRLVEITRGGRPTGPPHPATGGAADLTWLAPGSRSSWAVSAVAADGTGSGWSRPIQVTAPTAVPAEPAIAVSTVAPALGTRAAVTLSWPAVPGAGSYLVYNHLGQRRATIGPSLTIGGLELGAEYTYSVAAVNRAGFVTAPSPVVSVVTPRAPDPSVQVRTLMWDGSLRTFLVAVPALAGGAVRPAPAVVMIDGLHSAAGPFLGLTRILQPALAAGEVVIAPESLHGVWNDGRLDAPGAPGTDDVGFVLAAVDSLAAQGLVDPDRVTVAGFSNGAGLAMRIAAADPDRVAELVSFSGALLADGRAVLPTTGVPTVLVHGDADPVQPWDGRGAVNADEPAQLSQPATSAAWQTADGDTGIAPTVTTIPAPAWDPGLPATVVQSWGGPTPFAFYRIVGGGHSWPYEPCAVGTDVGCSADVRTDAAAEPFDGTALVVSIARAARITRITRTARR